jgi:putative FmdB family regulatory protein
MPTYRYQCKNCGHELEELQSMNEPPLVRCPACGTDSLARVMSGGAGLIFKGSGFYLTDYKKESASPGRQDGKKETAATGSEKSSGEKTGGKETSGEKPGKKETSDEKAEKKEASEEKKAKSKKTEKKSGKTDG